MRSDLVEELADESAIQRVLRQERPDVPERDGIRELLLRARLERGEGLSSTGSDCLHPVAGDQAHETGVAATARRSRARFGRRAGSH